MSRLREILICLVLVGVGAGLGTGTLSAFAAQSHSAGNELKTGTVGLDVDGKGSAMFTASAAQPGAQAPKCVKVTSTGSLDSQVRMYGSVTGGLKDYLTIEVVRGTATSTTGGSCSSFTADTTNHAGLGAGVLWRGPATSFPGTWAAGIVDPGTWSTGTSRAYQFNLTMSSNAGAQGLGAQVDVTWEAQNL